MEQINTRKWTTNVKCIVMMNMSLFYTYVHLIRMNNASQVCTTFIMLNLRLIELNREKQKCTK